MVTRNYTMGARADEVEARRAAVVRAMIDLSMERLTIDITLEDVAERAGVSVRTVLRQFGDRDGLFDAATEAAGAMIQAERAPAADDPGESLQRLLDHYELRGVFMLRLIAQEDDPRIGRITANGRLMHRDWVREVFEAWLPSSPAEEERLLDLLVVATDLFTWSLLRRDRGLTRTVTESRIHDLIAAVLGTDPFAPAKETRS